jgi:hypothetical protein
MVLSVILLIAGFVTYGKLLRARISSQPMQLLEKRWASNQSCMLFEDVK